MRAWLKDFAAHQPVPTAKRDKSQKNTQKEGPRTLLFTSCYEL
jgi:hypothetical protein